MRARLVAAVVLWAGCSPFSSSELQVTAIEPAMGPPTEDVPVRITGAGFHLPLRSDLDNGTAETIGALTVTVGTTPLADVVRRADSTIEGTIPRGLAIGSYDVTVSMGAASDVLMNGYTVVGAVSPVHLGPGDGLPGDAPLVLSGDVTIDTSLPMITVPLPAGDTFDLRPQSGGGSDVAVLHVGSLTIATATTVRVIGLHPLVIVSAGDVRLSGVLDGSAHGVVPGAGGAPPGMGPGAGSRGTHESANASDPGGGGAGYGTDGASGGGITGSCIVPGGRPGAAYGDATISILVGGSGGGTSSGTACTPDLGGAGGGAIQITSGTQIVLDSDGVINVGGGGGRGGTDCALNDVNSAGGAGAGGSIVLQAPSITNLGGVVAQGGGGGGSSFTGNGYRPATAVPG